MDNTDARRFRRRQDGVVFRVVVQARSPYGPVELVSTDGSSEVIHTTNDKLQIIFEFFSRQNNDTLYEIEEVDTKN